MPASVMSNKHYHAIVDGALNTIESYEGRTPKRKEPSWLLAGTICIAHDDSVFFSRKDYASMPLFIVCRNKQGVSAH